MTDAGTEAWGSTKRDMKKMTLKVSHESVFKLSTEYVSKLLWGRYTIVLCNRQFFVRVLRRDVTGDSISVTILEAHG